MSIAAVCVDRGRVVTNEPTGVRVEGRTSFEPVTGQWFKCRLFLTQSNDTAEPLGGRFSSVSQPQVLTPARDLDGKALVFHGNQQVEINSVQFGRHIWRAVGEPEPLRKKRRVIGWVVFVERVVENMFDDLLNQAVPPIYAPSL